MNSVYIHLKSTTDLGRPTVLNVLADLVIREESRFASVTAGDARALGRRSHARLRFVDESESSAVRAQAHDQLVGGKAELDEVVDGPIDVEEAVVAGFVGTRIEGDVSAGALLPGAVEIVGHQVDEVHLLGESGDFVGGVDGTFAASDGGGQEQTRFTGRVSLGVESL